MKCFPSVGINNVYTCIHTHTPENYLALKKKKSHPAICNTRDESEGHFILLHPS